MSVWEEKANRTLDAVLKSEHILEARKGRDEKFEIDFHGCRDRTTDFEVELLDNFFQEDIEEILKVEEIWRWLQEELREHVKDITSDVKSFVDGLGFEMEVFANKKLGDLNSDLQKIYKKRLNAEWQGLTPRQAKKKLPADQQYVAILDKKGFLTGEPYPVTMNMNAKLTITITEETIQTAWGKRKEREVHTKIEPPVKTEHGEHSGICHILKDGDVSAVAI